MGIVKRQSIKASIVNYTGALLGIVNMLFIFPRLVTVEQLGAINLLQFWAMLFVQLPLFGTTSLLFTYFSKSKNDLERKKLYTITMFFIILGLGLFTICFYVLKPFFYTYLVTTNNNQLFQPYLRLVLPMVWALSLYSYFEVYCFVKLRITVPSFIKEIGIRLAILIVLILYYFHYLQFNQVVHSIVFIYMLATIALYIYVLGKGYVVDLRFSFLKNYLKKEHLEYMFYLYLSAVSFSILSFFGSVWVGTKLGEASITIFNLGLYVATMIQIPYRAFSSIISPLIAEAWAGNDIERIKTINKQSGLNLILVGIFLYTLLVLNVHNICSFLPLKYEQYIGDLTFIIVVIGIGKLIDLCTGLNSEIIATSRYFKFMLVSVLIMAIATLAGNYYLIPNYGLKGAAVAFCIVQFLFNGSKFWFLFYKYKLSPYSYNALKIICTAILLGCLVYFIPVQKNIILDGILRSVIFSSLFLTIIIHYNFAPDLSELFKKIKTGKLL